MLNQSDRERFLEAGMDDYLAVPVSLEDFQRVFSKFFGEKESQTWFTIIRLLTLYSPAPWKVQTTTLPGMLLAQGKIEIRVEHLKFHLDFALWGIYTEIDLKDHVWQSLPGTGSEGAPWLKGLRRRAWMSGSWFRKICLKACPAIKGLKRVFNSNSKWYFIVSEDVSAFKGLKHQWELRHPLDW